MSSHVSLMPGDERVANVRSYLEGQQDKDLLRFITCGSVDDGKSTLIGRLLYDSKLIFEDQLATLRSESRTTGTVRNGGIDFSLLVDGLEAEREQGITIDVAYRFFATDNRRFIVADTPGHEQYTRNMATGASTAQAAVILVDARKGVLAQTRRHSFIVRLLGIKHLVLAVNKMDLVGFDEAVFARITSDYQAFVRELGAVDVRPIPISALDGDNVLTKSKRTDWYRGPTLMECLEEIPVEDDRSDGPFRFIVQWVNRPHLDFRGFSGTVASGSIGIGDKIIVLPSRRETRVDRIVTFDGDLTKAVAGEAVTLVLEDEIDVSRGDVLSNPEHLPVSVDQFAARLVWMSEHPMLPERQYLIKIGSRTVPATVTELKHKINVNTLEKVAAKKVELNEIALCNLSTDGEIVFDPYDDVRTMGGFIVIDRFTNETVGAGMMLYPLRRATNIRWQELDVNKAARASLKRQKPCVLWFTGLSGAGKSTIANLVERRLNALGRHTYLLDGDNVRHGLNRDLGFTDEDRVENIRRVAEVAKLFVDAGLIVLVSFISPFRSERLMAREHLEQGEFIEIFVDAPLNVCENRDPKGLYKKAREGKISNFTGLDSPYEAPEAPDIHLRSDQATAEEESHAVIEYLADHGIVPRSW